MSSNGCTPKAKSLILPFPLGIAMSRIHSRSYGCNPRGTLTKGTLVQRSGSFSQGSNVSTAYVTHFTYNFGQSTTYTMYKCWGFLSAQPDVLPFQHFLKIYLSAMCSDGCYSSQVLESKGNVVRSSLLAKLNQNSRQKTAPEKPFSEQTAYNYETAVGNPTMRRRRYCSQAYSILFCSMGGIKNFLNPQEKSALREDALLEDQVT